MQRQAVATSHQQPHTFERPPPPPPPALLPRMMLPGVEQPCGLFGTAVPAVSPASLSPPSLLTAGGVGSMRNRGGLDATQALFGDSQNISMLSTLFWPQITNFGTVQAATKDISRIPARPSIGITPPGLRAQLYWGPLVMPGPLHNQREG